MNTRSISGHIRHYNASYLITSEGTKQTKSAPLPLQIKSGPTLWASLCILIGCNWVIGARPDSQREVVEAHGPQGEGSGQQTHVREQDSDGVLEAGQLLEDGGRLDQLPVRLRLLDLQEGNESSRVTEPVSLLAYGFAVIAVL